MTVYFRVCFTFCISLLLAPTVRAQLNQCPAADGQLVSVRENLTLFVRGGGAIGVVEVTNSFALNATDPNGDALQVRLVDFPDHGVLFSCSPNPGRATYTCVNFPGGIANVGPAPRLLYVPDIQYRGTDTFSYTVNDGQCTSAVATVSIAIENVNHAPVPVIDIKQVRVISGLAEVVIAPGDGPLHVKVDASGTIDDGPFPLTFGIAAGSATSQTELSNGVVCLEYPTGTPYSLVQVYATDQVGATGFRQFFFNIHTPAQVLDDLLILVDLEFFGIRDQRPNRAPLETARDAFAAGDTAAATAALEAFQERVMTHLARKEPAGAEWWDDTAQWIIDSVTIDHCAQ